MVKNLLLDKKIGKNNNEYYKRNFKVAKMNEDIEYYNNKIIQVKLKGLTPAQAREQALKDV